MPRRLVEAHDIVRVRDGVALGAGLLLQAVTGLAVWQRRVAEGLFVEDAGVSTEGAEYVQFVEEGQAVAE